MLAVAVSKNQLDQTLKCQVSAAEFLSEAPNRQILIVPSQVIVKRNINLLKEISG